MGELKIFRGPRNEFEFNKIKENSTAGGKRTAANPTSPTEDEYETYNRTTKATAGECMPPKPNEEIYTDFTEYTMNHECAAQFGRRCGAYIEATVDERYVRRFDDDSLENGVLIRSDTPITIQKIYRV